MKNKFLESQVLVLGKDGNKEFRNIVEGTAIKVVDSNCSELIGLEGTLTNPFASLIDEAEDEAENYVAGLLINGTMSCFDEMINLTEHDVVSIYEPKSTLNINSLDDIIALIREGKDVNYSIRLDSDKLQSGDIDDIYVCLEIDTVFFGGIGVDSDYEEWLDCILDAREYTVGDYMENRCDMGDNYEIEAINDLESRYIVIADKKNPDKALLVPFVDIANRFDEESCDETFLKFNEAKIL